jgi:hypothetical protein
MNNFVAFFAQPDPEFGDSIWVTVRQIAVFLVASFVVIELGKWAHLSTSAGFAFGYFWGALRVYATMRRHGDA